MICPADDVSDSVAFFRKINSEAARSRVPLSVSIALTHRCNLRCCHCYVRPGGCNEESGVGEMSTRTILRILDECADAGSLSVVLTGGEPLLRSDFPDIFRAAKMKGLLVAVFTNGTLIDDDIVALFVDLPPRCVEISIYGATAHTHESVTGVQGSYGKMIHGLERLLAAGVNVKLKTMLMAENIDEFHDMEKMAESYGVKFRFDAGIFPALDGSRSPLASRVSPRQAVETEFSDPDRATEWRDLYKRNMNNENSDKLYFCAAGVTSFHINPAGFMLPCLLSKGAGYDLANGNLAEGWREMGLYIESKRAGKDFHCRHCSKKILCGYCPAFFELESGNEKEYSTYLCEIGQKRFELISTENQEINVR